MPCDFIRVCEGRKLFDDILNEISYKCDGIDTDRIIIGGDFNTDFSRHGSMNKKILKLLIESENLKCPLYLDVSSILYSFESKCNGDTSIIDHILVSENLYCNIMKCSCLHEGDNLSDHSPVIISLNIAIDNSHHSF